MEGCSEIECVKHTHVSFDLLRVSSIFKAFILCYSTKMTSRQFMVDGNKRRALLFKKMTSRQFMVDGNKRRAAKESLRREIFFSVTEISPLSG